ncbi:MAG TPA: hypothetical protein VEW42_03165 [Candidatus Eisenbacteria bacterium]|nr:hypothetical protein [Candidatus Eisenbacteria bacterium]
MALAGLKEVALAVLGKKGEGKSKLIAKHVPQSRDEGVHHDTKRRPSPFFTGGK